MIVPDPLACAACGRAPARLRLVDLEAESRLTGIEPGTVTVQGAEVPARWGWEPRCDACWERFRAMREEARR